MVNVIRPRGSGHEFGSDPEDRDPLASLKNSLFMTIGLTNLPEFRGAPYEDVEQFLREFSRATTTLLPEQKCIALKKALVGDASIYAKKYLKEELLHGQWKQVKASLRNRFSRIEPSLLYRTELNKMSFDPVQSTLLGYIDRYAGLYKKVHQAAADNEMILDISLNLGQHIVLKLNQLSGNWRSLANFEDFRELISRLERDIMSLERDTANQTTQELASTVNKLVSTALQPPIKEFQDLITRLSQKASQEPDTENVAALKHGKYPDRSNETKRDAQASGKRSDRDWGEDRPFRQGFKKSKDLKRAYEDKFGEPPGPCYYCGGHHFRRHCPLDMPDLKEQRDHR